MASPQLEGGFTRISNEVLESLMKAKLNGTELALVMTVIRMTWGWRGKKENHISLKLFQTLTGRHRNLIMRGLQALQKRNIVQQTQKPTIDRAAQWRFNKDWESWGGGTKEGAPVPRKVGTKEGAGGGTKEGAGGGTKEGALLKREEKKKKRQSIGDRVFDRWISHTVLKRHKRLTPLMRKFTNSKITAGYKEEELFLVIDNYAKLKAKSSAPGYGNWGLDKLMRNTEWFDSLLDADWEGFNNIGGKQDDEPKFL